MKLGALGITSVIIALTVSIGSASAYHKRESPRLGAPLYAGPNVVIIENGRSGSSITLSGGGKIYGQPPRYGRGHNHGYGRGYNRGYRWKGAPGRYRQPGPRYYDPYRRGTGRGYGRERYPNPNVNPGRGYGGNGYDNRRYNGRDNRSPRLTILGATYRSIDGRTCNAYSYAHKKCDGNQSCTVKASNKICGDPDRGRLKILDVTYTCGNQQHTSSTPERSRSQIRCR